MTLIKIPSPKCALNLWPGRALAACGRMRTSKYLRIRAHSSTTQYAIEHCYLNDFRTIPFRFASRIGYRNTHGTHTHTKKPFEIDCPTRIQMTMRFRTLPGQTSRHYAQILEGAHSLPPGVSAATTTFTVRHTARQINTPSDLFSINIFWFVACCAVDLTFCVRTRQKRSGHRSSSFPWWRVLCSQYLTASHANQSGEAPGWVFD